MAITKHFIRFCLWITLTICLLIAIATVALRLFLPNLNHYKQEIESSIAARAGVKVNIGNLDASWHYFTPSLIINDLTVDLNTTPNTNLFIKKASINLDLLSSLYNRTLKLDELILEQLDLDMSQIAFNLNDSTPKPQSAKKLALIQSLLLNQFEHLSIINSNIKFKTMDQAIQKLNIASLYWKNQAKTHQAQGVISLAGKRLNQLEVRANLKQLKQVNKLGVKSISGQIYLNANKIELAPWMPLFTQEKLDIINSQASFETWIDLSKDQLKQILVKFKPSVYSWSQTNIEPSSQAKKSSDIDIARAKQQNTKQQNIVSKNKTQDKDLSKKQHNLDKQEHQLFLDAGNVIIKPSQGALKIYGQDIRLLTDKVAWPKLSFIYDQNEKNTKLNIDQVQLERLWPVVHLVPEFKKYMNTLDEINPKAKVQDIRLKMAKEQTKYSFEVQDAAFSASAKSPGFTHLNANITGNQNAVQIKAALKQSQLSSPYIFQEPINIDDAQIELLVHKAEQESQGVDIDLKKLAFKNEDLDILGQLSLKLRENQAPFLSMYAETDLNDIGQIWRYLPAKLISPFMMDYLSTSIQAGYAKKAKLLWYGSLSQYPYPKQQGTFQANISLEDADYAFLTQWPNIHDMQLELNFINDALYFNSHHAKTMDVTATDLKAVIPHLASDGHIKLEAKLIGKGKDVRSYMAATPLVNTVGAALNTVQVQGDVSAGLNLNIPFNNKKSIISGHINLKNNDIHVTTPPINLKNISGSVDFLNDEVKSSALQGKWLEQPITLNFQGKSQSKGYQIDLSTEANWNISKLNQQIKQDALSLISGDIPWDLNLNLLASDVGFNYEINGQGSLNKISSAYPAPFNYKPNSRGAAKFYAKGDAQDLSVRLRAPALKYQAKIDLNKKMPEISASRILIGHGNYASDAYFHHSHILDLKASSFDLDKWLSFAFGGKSHSQNAKPHTSEQFTLPSPSTIGINVSKLTAAGMSWNRLKMQAKKEKNSSSWRFDFNGDQIKGGANFNQLRQTKYLDLNLEHLKLTFPTDPNKKSKAKSNVKTSPKHKRDKYTKPLPLTSLEKNIFKYIPNLKVKIQSLWVQGYKLGTLRMQLERQGNKLAWRQLDLRTGSNQLSGTGFWQVLGNKSYSGFNMNLNGQNNSEVMQAFGISSGLQKAKFDANLSAKWQGVPWSIHKPSLNGGLSVRFDDGVIAGINNGAVKLLGIFSLDSILRKMRLDFTGVFDDGMAFSSITGTGKVTNGMFITNDLKMDAMAGEMEIKGRANLVTNHVNAQVSFTPEFTSSIPVLSAFVVAPPAAVAVLAITKVLTPVVDVVTKVKYSIKGPFDKPKVKEISRLKSEYKLPKWMRNELF